MKADMGIWRIDPTSQAGSKDSRSESRLAQRDLHPRMTRPFPQGAVMCTLHLVKC